VIKMKKYRVVCSKPQFANNIYVDIAPENGTTHEQIFFSREQLHKRSGGEKLELITGSVYLQDNNGLINIDFPSPNVPKKRYLEYNAVMRLYESLKKEIITAYETMIKSGYEQTLDVYSPNMMMAIKNEQDEQINAYNKRRQQQIGYAEKHIHKINSQASNFPQNLQQENNLWQMTEFSLSCKRRVASTQNRARQDAQTDPILRMKIKQMQYSGD